jgi:hypothetical protein
LIIIKNKAFLGFIIPAGISRTAVRGFKASNFRSINLLNAMAELRAVTIQTKTNKNNFNEKEKPSCNANVKPIQANGNANMV